MKIGMVFYDMQEFGGLEEYASALAIALSEQGHEVQVFSCAWTPADNQYLARLRQHRISVVQPPKWVSLPASDWDTKERLIARLLWLLTPVVYLLGLFATLLRKKPWRGALTSARNWLQGQLGRLISPDRRQPITRFLLSLWTRLWQPDVLHLQGYTTNLLYVIEWAHRKRIPVVYEEHQTPDPMFNWWRNFEHTINKASLVVAVSQKSAQALREVCRVHRPIRVRSPLMTDPRQAHPDAALHPRRESDTFNVVTIARLYETKGLNFLLDAVVLVHRRHPYVRFKVYGDGPLREELMGYAAKLGLDGNSIFMGAFEHDQLPRILAQADLFVLSSILEGQPLALVEAMACGCPVVATAVGGIPEIVQDGVNGFLCPPADPACLAERICRLIEDEALRRGFAQAARRTYEQGPFQPEAVARELIKIYQEAVELATRE